MDVGQLNARTEERIRAIQPLWSVPNFKSKAVAKKWFYETLEILETIHEPRIRGMHNNILWYTGEYDPNLEYRLVSPERVVAPVPKYQLPVVVNHIYDLTEQRVARLSQYKPAYDALPNNNEESDRVSARLMKSCLDDVNRKNKFDFLMLGIERWCAVLGEMYLRVNWNPDLGDLDPKTKKPVGDVELTLKEPFYVLYEPKMDWRKVNFLIEIDEIAHVEEVKAKYGVKDLKADDTTTIYSFQGDTENSKLCEEVVVYRLLYKPCKQLPGGLIMRICGDTVLEFSTEKWPYSHGEFEYERLTDIDVPGRVFPISYYTFLIPMQHQYNKMTSMIHRSITLGAHFKWFMTKGACNVKDLGNSHTIVQVNPGMPEPKIQAFNTVPQDVFQYRTDMRSELQTLSGIQGVSRGTPPSGARAASMLRFYEEQEMQRSSTQIMKHNEFVRCSVSKEASIIGDYYPLSKHRLIRVVGRENQYEIEKLATDKISSGTQIIIQNSTGFSESMSGRLEEVGFLMEKVPGLLSPQQAADIIGLRAPNKFYSVATASLRAAENENQDFLDGKPVKPPEPFEDMIQHWIQHSILMQSSTFKNLPKRMRDAAILHQQMTEGLMEEQAKRSPAFQQQLTSLPGYPMFWTMEPTSSLTPPPQMPEQGGKQGKPQQMNTGGQVPTQGGSQEQVMPELAAPEIQAEIQ